VLLARYNVAFVVSWYIAAPTPCGNIRFSNSKEKQQQQQQQQIFLLLLLLLLSYMFLYVLLCYVVATDFNGR